MTALYIGGAAQGKRALAQKLHSVEAAAVLESGAAVTLADAHLVAGLHLLVREVLAQGGTAESLLPQLRGKIVVCDEVGCGIVPLDATDRDWREQTGRLCCALAAEAELVVRVIAGVPQVLRGTLPQETARGVDFGETERNE